MKETQSHSQSEKSFVGQMASMGFSYGPALVLKNERVQLTHKKSLPASDEVTLFRDAIKKASADLEGLKERSSKQGKSQSVEILDAHLVLLGDPEVEEQTLGKINSGSSAEESYYSVIEEFRKMFLNLEDDYLKQRALDLQDIRERVLFYIQHPKENFPDLNVQNPVIIIAKDLTPSQILSIEKSKLLGFVTIEGGSTSHTAILARSLEVPALVGMSDDILKISSGHQVALNGETGHLLVNPTEDSRKNFLSLKAKYDEKVLENSRLKGQASETLDKHQLTLASNISGPQDLDSFWRNDSEAVGLYRTEFLFLDRATAPTEEEQYKVYKEVFDGLKGKSMLVRTLDIGGDKKADYLKMKHEENPFLGIRALRLCFQRPEIFKTQLRALLRAGAGAKWGLMFPMVSQLEELLQAKTYVEEVKKELKAEGKTYSHDFQIGIMVEIPSVAWMMDVFAPHVDFVSLGTNDLLQYTCAADRLNPELKSVYSPYNLGFLRQVHHVLSTCHEKHVHAGICGSLSHHKDLMPFFIGCGVNELSMTSQHVLPTRAAIHKLNYKKCQELVKTILASSTAAEIHEKFQKFKEM